MYCVQTKALTHHFVTGKKVLDNINMQVPKGSVYGFLGPNGAGKTTTLRLLLGLIKKQAGEIEIFGQSLRQQRLNILKNTGSMIESPSIYGHLTARENLLLLQKIYRCPVSRINEVLQVVGLHDTGSKKASQFSLGMKQRLGIAVALLNQPALLVLDEPTNGLDPNGIIEMRDLLRRLNEEQQISIIISSHLLAEIEKMVTHVGIISKGCMVFQGTLNDLVSKQQRSSAVMLETSNNEKAKSIISSLSLEVLEEQRRLLLPVLPKATVAALNAKLVNNGIDVYEISTQRKDLETIFIELINS